LLKNPGFEEPPGAGGGPANWNGIGNGVTQIAVTDKEAHEGRRCISVPAATAVEQRVDGAESGAYRFQAWVKSDADQPVTIVLQDPDRPWEAYSCTEVSVPKNQWTQVQAFCVLDKNGSLAAMVGGMTDEFRLYHGLSGKMGAQILLDGCELTRFEAVAKSDVEVWDAKKELSGVADLSVKGEWDQVRNASFAFKGSPVFQARHLAGTVRATDGGLVIYAVQGEALQARTVLTPSPAFDGCKSELVHSGDRTGIRVTSKERSYTAWLTSKGLLRIEASQVAKFQAQNCGLRYGILPSLTGSDICYDPKKLLDSKEIKLPSTQWFVGLVNGNDSMMVAAWDSDSQAVSLGMTGDGENRMFDSFSIATDTAGFSISFVEHPGIWHKEALQEDWLSEYTPVAWKPPFPARWMGEFFVSTGGRPYLSEPYMQYSFPFANAKTRMWGVWFEDWNRYPFYFDGDKTIFHFEKGFVPKGDALVYFLEPAAADLYSPCEILEQALGTEKAEALLDLEANQLRKLSYSTPQEFMYDRPVCATTTRLGKIPAKDKGTVGVNLATHLYEFIREIRGRLGQYVGFFDGMQTYLDGEEKAHPDLHPYISELRAMVAQTKPKAEEIYSIPLASVQEKTDGMKKLLLAGGGDGFNCGDLDVRDTAGEQDDLCRHYNRIVLRLSQTAALKCGDSPEKALIAQHIWNESRAVLRRPVRWESRRTLYFFEP
jgi:hypothetical protein